MGAVAVDDNRRPAAPGAEQPLHGAPPGGADLVAVLEGLPDPVVVVDGDARLVWGNRAAERWSGWRREELEGTSAADLVHPDDALTALASLDSVQRKEVGTVVEIRLRDRAGRYSHFDVRGSAVDGVGVVLVLRDQTDRRRWEVTGGDGGLLQVVVDAAPAITMLLDRAGRLRGASRALTTILGRDLEHSLGCHLAELAVPEAMGLVARQLEEAAVASEKRSFEAAFTSLESGRPVPLNVTVVNLLDDRSVEGLVVTAVDISSLAAVRDRLAHLAGHDPLTGLPNRSLLFDRLGVALEHARRSGTPVSVVYCDVDDFKQVNDVHGHAAGDHVLVELGNRLLSLTRSSDTVARIGGDELVVVTEEDGTAGRELLARIAAAVAVPVRLPSGKTVRLSVSAGLVTGDGDTSADQLLALADEAMYRGKREALRRASGSRAPRG